MAFGAQGAMGAAIAADPAAAEPEHQVPTKPKSLADMVKQFQGKLQSF
jgi:hypothetical protein